jgi:hypothetical protein
VHGVKFRDDNRALVMRIAAAATQSPFSATRQHRHSTRENIHTAKLQWRFLPAERRSAVFPTALLALDSSPRRSKAFPVAR